MKKPGRRALGRSFPFKPSTGKIAVKAINHYGDEALKVFDLADAREA